MKSKFTAAIALLILGTLSICSAASGAEQPKDKLETIKPVPFTAVHLNDEFWAPRIETNRSVTIPYAFGKCEETGRVENFVRAAKRLRGERLEDDQVRGYSFDDTDISESPLKKGLLYAGTDDGQVHVTRDDGAHWIKINQGLPDRWVTRLVASKYEVATVFVSLTGYRDDDFEKYLYMSTDFGKTWKSLTQRKSGR